MNYFVHPQIKFNPKNIANLKLCFLKPSSRKIKEKLEQMFPGKQIYFTDMGRSAFRLIIEQSNLQNSKMLAPAYLCDIFFPIFKQYNIAPVFLDIDKETFNIDIGKIKKKLNPEVKSILIVHTYGLPVDIKKIKEIVFQSLNSSTTQLLNRSTAQPFIIEDCAHSFGASLSELDSNRRFLGNSGETAFFSLYKFFPTLRGGIAVLPQKLSQPLPKTSFTLRDFVSLLNAFSFFAFLFKKYAGKIAPQYIKKEKLSQPSQLNRVSLNIFAWQMKNFEKTLEKRKELARYFSLELKEMGFQTQPEENNTFTYLSALCPENIDRDKFVLSLRKKGVFALRIWKTPIILNPQVQKEYNLDPSLFPNTLEVAKRIINFPLQNFYQRKDIEKMAEKIKKVIG